jgi:hypothetical protein
MNGKTALLNKIVQHLILHTSASDDLGLLSGKMGVCVFFYRYSRHTGVKRYADFAGHLLDEIYGEITIGTDRNFGKGLAGVCWGIEYLVRNGFVNADTDDVLEDIDKKVWELDVRRISDTSLDKGLDGFAHYVLARCTDKQSFPIDRQYISDLKRNMNDRVCCPELSIQLDRLLRNEAVDYTLDLLDTLASKCKIPQEGTLKKTNLGILKNGLAGMGLKLINEPAR